MENPTPRPPTTPASTLPPVQGATWVDAAALLCFIALEGWWLARLVGPLDALGLLLLPLPLLIGHALADLLSGLAHWLGDRFGTPRTPWIGKRFILPFREHHVDPLAITHHGFLEVNGSSALILVVLSAPFALWWPATGAAGLIGVGLWWAFMALLLTNQFHYWAHCAAPPRWVTWLQRAHLVLPPGEHEIHHRAPHDTHYCITCGWLNGALARHQVFERCERLLGRPVDEDA